MNSHPNISAYFVKHKPDLEEDVVLNNDTIYTKGIESWRPGCLVKTVQSIQYLLQNQVEFDYIFRTNMSSVVNLTKLYDAVSINDKHMLYAGVVTEYFGLLYASGAGILMNKIICEILIQNRQYLDYETIDDVAIGNLFKHLGIALTPLKI